MLVKSPPFSLMGEVMGKEVPMLFVVVAQSLRPDGLCATPWTVAHQAPVCMAFSSKNTGVGCHALLQGIFLTQGLNLGLLHCRWILYQSATREVQCYFYL